MHDIVHSVVCVTILQGFAHVADCKVQTVGVVEEGLVEHFVSFFIGSLL